MATVPNFSQPVILSEVATPTVPDSGYLKVYAKSGTLYSIANGGSENIYATSSDLSVYLPLAGGTLTGQLTIPYGDSTNPSILIGNTNTGIHGLNDASRRIRFTVAGQVTAEYASGAHIIQGSLLFGTLGSSPDAGILSPATDVVEVRYINRNTTAQTFQLNNTWTSSTSFENLRIKANAGAAYQIGSAIGSAGGTNREVQIGHWSSAGVFTPALYIGTAGRIGIGTSPANYRWLDITGSETTGNGVQVCITNTATDGYSTAVLNFRTGASGVGGNISGFATNFANYGVTNGLNFSGATSTDNIAFRTGSALLSGSGVAARFFISSNGNIGVNTQSPTSLLHVIGLAQTALTASTESIEINFDLSSTKQFATGALTTQRAMRIQAPTYSFVGASTITTASTLSISGPPIAGTNATITNAYALNVESGKSRFGDEINLINGSNQTLRIAMDTNNPIISSAFTRMIVSGTAVWLRTDGGVFFMRSDDSEIGRVSISGFSLTMQSNTNGPLTLTVPTSGNSNQGANAVNVIGQTALSSSTNVLGGGAVNITGGNGASASAGNAYGGDIVLTPGTGYGTGRQGVVSVLGPITNTSTGITEIRYGTTAQTFRVYNTYTSSTSGEYGQHAWISNEYRIGTGVGSAGGAQRSVSIGTWNSVGAWTPGFTVATTGVTTCHNTLNISAFNGILMGGDLTFARDVARTLELRGGTSPVTFEVSNTYTSSTVFENLQIRGVASANFEIGPQNGSAGGTLRGLTIGGYSAGSTTITPWMSFTGSTGELGIFGNGVVRQNRYSDDTTAAIYAFRKYRGTESVPTEVQSGDLIGQILFQGYHGSTIGTSAAIQVIATEAFTSAPNRPTRMAFNTTAPGDTQSSIRMTITDVGTTWFGSYSTSYTNSCLVGIAGSNASGAENNTLLFRDNSTLNGIGQVLGKIAFWSADTTAPGAGIKAWISCVSESATVANAAIVFATDTTTGTPTEQMRITSGGNVGIGTGSTVSARTHVISTTEQLRIGYDSGDYYSTTVSSTGAVTFDAVGSAPLFAFSKLVGQSAAEITNTPAATSQTITLNNGNHQTLTLTSATGTVAVTLTVPSKVSSGTIIVKQHATTPRNITWAVSAGTIKWMGTQPAWSSDGVTEIRIVSWRYDGSVMYLMSTDVAS